MDYNFVTNIAGCIPSATKMMNGNLDLVYYSHIPVAIVSLLIGFFVIFKNYKSLSARVMFSLSIIFSLWVICSIYKNLFLDSARNCLRISVDFWID